MGEMKYQLLWSSDSETRRSTSAGGFYLIAREFLKLHSDNASVYGCGFRDVRTVTHLRVTNIDELPHLQGSKYVQSDISKCFDAIAQDLNAQRYVLFSGTSCQAAAIQNYPFRNKEKLFVIDVLCHGVPSPGFWRAYVDVLEEKYHGTITNLSFRNKSKTNRMGYLLKFTCNGKTQTVFQDADFYYKSFIDGDSLRPSCYVCPFVGEYQTSDLTLADSNNKRFHSSEAISLAIVRNEKGNQLLQMAGERFEFMETTLDAEAQTNRKLIVPTVKTAKRDEFYKKMRPEDMTVRIRKMALLIMQVKSFIPTKLKDKLKGVN